MKEYIDMIYEELKKEAFNSDSRLFDGTTKEQEQLWKELEEKYNKLKKEQEKK